MDDDADRVVVTLDRVRKQFGDFVAVHRADLSIRRGEFFAMLGPSGCGKTTTLKMIAGFEQPTEGRVLLEGVDVSRVPPHKRNVNTVFQQYALFPHLTVAENVAFGPRAKRVAKGEYRSRVRQMLDIVRLTELADRKPAQLSGGQQQRVALARALVNYPSALLLDEPLAALDLKLREAMQLELKRIQSEVGITFVFVTHDQGEALTMSDRIAVMSEGAIEQIGTPQEIYHRPASLFVAGFIGSANLLPGTVSGRAGEETIIDLECGTTVRAAGVNPPGLGAAASIVVRPERLHVATAAGAEGRSLQGTIGHVIFQGAAVRIQLTLADGTEVVALAGPDDELPVLRPGSPVHVCWSPGAVYVLAGRPSRPGVNSTDVDQVEAAI